MKVLVIGSGGREHALVWKLASSPLVTGLYALPGNPGMEPLADLVPGRVTDAAAIERFAREQKVGLVVVGPEDPLAEGLVDRLTSAGIKAFGPTRQAAQIEADKWFAKELMRQQAVPTAEARSFTDADEAIHLIKANKPDLIFLDIAMPVKNGFELLKELEGISFEVIFVTAHNQFMVEAFHFSAIDYLLKPVEDNLLMDAVNRAKKRIAEKSGTKNIETFLHNIGQRQSPQKMRLCIPSLKGFQVIELDDILYAESSGNYTNLYFANNKMVCTSKPMHEYEKLLEDAGFVRIHKSILVNLLHVKEYLRGEGGSVILSNGQEVEVARRKKDLLIAKMKEYYKF